MSDKFHDWVSVKQKKPSIWRSRSLGGLMVAALFLSTVTIGHASRAITFNEWLFEYHDCDSDNPFFEYDEGTCNPGLLLRVEIYLILQGWLD
ncbi:MAG: hypothetical protein GXP10_01145 [Gammaproteobacteria bacterium]|nr:hypothetical protein [Gammaproteobacteria bacterium]